MCTGRKWIDVAMFSSAERTLVLVARRACGLWVDAHDVQVQRVHVAVVARERRDSVELGDGFVVGGELTAPDLGVALDLVELAERDRREHVGEVRLVAGHRDVVERAVAAAHQPQVANRLRDLVAVRRDQPALARGDVLRRVEREAGHLGDRADLPPAVPALGGVRRVLDDRDSELEQRIEVGRLPGEVDRQDRLRPLGHGLAATRPDRC